VKPEIARVLEVTTQQLMLEIAPHVAPSYRQASVFATGLLLTSIREELDRSAARRIEENRALVALFAEAAPAVEDERLRARLAEAASAAEPDFLLSALEARNAALRDLLIALHAHVETLATPAARELESAIWRELRASTERRRLSLHAF